MHPRFFSQDSSSNPSSTTTETTPDSNPSTVGQLQPLSENRDLALLEYALMRVSNGRRCHETDGMCIETVLVKLCLEMTGLVFAQNTTRTFRISLATIPYTAQQALNLLRTMLNNKQTLYYIKWINNSPVQRDFRSIIKNFMLLDRYGCKAEVPEVDLPSWKHSDYRRGMGIRNIHTAPPAVKLNPRTMQSQ